LKKIQIQIQIHFLTWNPTCLPACLEQKNPCLPADRTDLLVDCIRTRLCLVLSENKLCCAVLCKKKRKSLELELEKKKRLCQKTKQNDNNNNNKNDEQR
jgi:hypothetical protein